MRLTFFTEKCVVDVNVNNYFYTIQQGALALLLTTNTTEIMATIHLTKEGFLKKIADYEKNPGNFEFLGDKPALIDFYADWCGPCKMLAPVLEDVSVKYTGKVDVYKVNVEQEEELSALFGVRSIPTLVFIPMDGRIQASQGAMGRPQLEEAVEKILLE